MHYNLLLQVVVRLSKLKYCSSCFEDNVEHHVLKCNARELTDLPYMKRNINQRADMEEEPTKTPLSNLSDQDLLAFIAKVEKIHQGILF